MRQLWIRTDPAIEKGLARLLRLLRRRYPQASRSGAARAALREGLEVAIGKEQR